MTPAQPDIDVRELCAKLRQRNVLQKGKTVMLDMGDGPKPVSTGDTVQVRNPDGDEAATALETLEERVKVLEEGWAFVWKWIERGMFDAKISQTEAIEVLAYYPGAPWQNGRWDVDHKPYAEQFYKAFPKARP